MIPEVSVTGGALRTIKGSTKVTEDSIKVIEDPTRVIEDSTRNIGDSVKVIKNFAKIIRNSKGITKGLLVLKNLVAETVSKPLSECKCYPPHPCCPIVDYTFAS